MRLYKEKFKSQINDCTLESVEKNAQGRFSKTGHMSSFGKLQVGMSLSVFFPDFALNDYHCWTN